MALAKEVYQALEDIVGPRNISNDPAVLVAYQFPLSVTSIHMGPFYRTLTPRGGAVVLPEAQKKCRRSSRSATNIKPSSKLPAPFLSHGLSFTRRHSATGHAANGPHTGDRQEKPVLRG